MISNVLDKHAHAPCRFTSGGERRLIEILRHFQRANHEVTVLTTKDSSMALEEEQLKVRMVVLESFLVKIESSNIGVVLSYFFRILSVVAVRKRVRVSFDAVIAATALLPDVLASLFFLSKCPKAKGFVYFHHMFNLTCPSANTGYFQKIRSLLFSSVSALQQRLALRIIKKIHVSVFALPVTARALSKMLGREQIRIIENGVNLESVWKTRATSSFDGIYVGRLSAKKGAYDLIDIWRRVCSRYEHAKLAIVGSVEDPLVIQKVKTCKLGSNISIYEVVDEIKKFELLKSAKVFLFPSHEEGWGTAVSEALACEIPVVAYDLPAYSYAGDSIVRVVKGDTEAFANQVIRLLSGEEARKALSAGARKRVKDWSEIARNEIAIIAQ